MREILVAELVVGVVAGGSLPLLTLETLDKLAALLFPLRHKAHQELHLHFPLLQEVLEVLLTIHVIQRPLPEVVVRLGRREAEEV
jgi:hypothetical protein